MTREVPALGTAEDDFLEFKSAKVLESPDLTAVGRGVVAFLNASLVNVSRARRRAYLWIGIAEAEERAVGFEQLKDPSATKRRIEDFLCDSIEPKPTSDEIDVSIVAVSQGGSVIAIGVRGFAARAPYALILPRGARAYLMRVGARVRPMDRDEIAAAFHAAARARRSGGAERDLEGFRRLLAPDRIRAQKRFVLAIAPQFELQLRLTALHSLLDQPALSGNRNRAFTVFTEQVPSVESKDHISVEIEGERSLRIGRKGAIVFEARAEYLLAEYRGNRFWPFAVLEIPTSFVRLAREIYRTASPTDEVEFRFGLRLTGMTGTILPPYSPRSIAALVRDAERPANGDIAIDATWSWADLAEHDDRLAYRIVQRFYAEFDLGDREIPAEFDASARILRLPN